jgi:hypothetical protein
MRTGREYVKPEGVWLSDLQDDPCSGMRRSLDVVISAGEDSSKASVDIDERLRIDILSVEIRWPASGKVAYRRGD